VTPHEVIADPVGSSDISHSRAALSSLRAADGKSVTAGYPLRWRLAPT